MTTTREQEQQEEGEYLDPVFNLQVCNTPEYTEEHNTGTISSGAFSLSPGGGTNDFYMNVQSNAVNARLTDSYSLTGGILSLINVYLLDPEGSDISKWN